jgi:ABC-type bacteriocin/lantibiotic exporter with double-glycine peptidase domain
MTGSDTSEWRWLWREVRPFAWYQVGSLVCMLASSALGLAGPLVMKWLIDDVLPNRRWAALAVATAGFFLIYLGRSVASLASGLVNMVGLQRLVFHVRTRLLRHLQALPAVFYGKRPVGDLVQRLEQDVALVGDAGSTILPSIMLMVIETIMTASAMIFLDWRLSSIVAPLLPVFGYLRYRYRTILRKCAEEVREVAGQQSSLLNEVLTGAIQIQLLGAEHRFWRRYGRLNIHAMQKQFRQRRHELTFTLLTMTTIGLGTSLIIGYGGSRVLDGTMTAGSLVAFYAYVGQIFHPMSTALDLYARLTRLRASVRRLMDLEQEPSAIHDVPDAIPLPASPGALVCTNLTFGYARDKPPVLRHVDFDARAGDRIAIVGASGCGKSSLLKLIPRLYDVDEGRIEIDGCDTRALQMRTLRHAVSFVPQDPILFHGTLSDNLRHGAPASTPDDLAQAAWIACLTEVVARLPGHWDAELGPMGVGLSGGERQRVAIARALLQRRPILVLDEATSALDAPTEHRLLSRLKPWCGGRTVIIVSHRSSAARWANRVVVMHRGQIVEDGTHESLYQPGTLYHALWRRTQWRDPARQPVLTPEPPPIPADTADVEDIVDGEDRGERPENGAAPVNAHGRA